MPLKGFKKDILRNLIDGCKDKSYEQRLKKLNITSMADRHYL